MATLREILSFVITADAAQAIREFDKLEKSSTKSLGAIGDPTLLGKSAAQWTKIGTAAGGFTLIAGAGLYKAASAAGDLEKSMARLDAAFGDSADSVKDLVSDMRFLSDRDASRFAADIGEAAQGLGLAADESARLTPEVVDVASQLAVIKGLDMGTALESISAALRGEFDATQRLVPALSAARIEQEALAATGKERTKDLTTAEKAQAALNIVISDGTKIVEGNTEALNSQSAKMTESKARLDDAMVAFGAGALPAVEGMTSVISGLAEAFSALPTSVTNAAGKTAAYTVGLSALVSAVSFAASGIIKLKGALDNIGGSADNAGKSTSRLATAAKGAGIALAALAVSDVVFGFLNEATGNTQRFTDALNDFTAKSADASMSTRTLATDFTQMAKEQEKALKISSLWEGFGADIVTNFDGVKVTIEDTQDALDSLSPRAAAEALDALQDVTDSLAEGSDQRKTNQEFIDKNRKSLDLEADAAAANANATDDMTDAQKESAESTKAQEAATKALKKALDEAQTPLETLAAGYDTLATKGDAFGQSLELSSQLDELSSSAAEMGEAFKASEETFKNLPENIDLTKAALGGYNEEQTKAIGGLDALATSVQDYLGSLIAADKSNEEVALSAAVMRASLEKQMKQAGLTTDQVNAYIDMLGLTPEDVNTAIKLSGDAEAKAKLSAIQGQMALLDAGVQMEITQKILAGDWQGAAATAQAGVQDYMNKHPVNLTFAAAQAKAALDRLMRGSQFSFGTPAPGRSVTPQYVTVNMPAGSDGRSVLSALRRHSARNGSLV